MDIKIEPDDEILSPNSAESTYHSDYPDNDVDNLWSEGPSTDNRYDSHVKQEQIEEQDFQDDKKSKSLNDQNNEQCLNIKSEENDMPWENYKDDGHINKFPIKTERLDVGECSYAETTTVQCMDVNIEPSFTIENPCLNFSAAQSLIPYNPFILNQELCYENIVPEEEQVAIVLLENTVFYERNYVCSTCFSIFPSVELLEVHKSVHFEDVLDIEYDCTQEIPIEYTESEHSKDLTSKLINKRKISTLQKRFKCNVCEYSSAHSYSLKTHTMIHTGEKPFKCDQCEYKTAYSFHLKSHKMSHSSEKSLKCDQCEFTSAHFNSLKRHKIIHSGVKPFKCDQCNYKATSSFLLRKHKTSHSNEKPFKCDSCDFTCANSSNLKRHNMIHSGEKPFKCDQCEFKTIYSFHFKMHKLLHTGQKPYRCDVCDYKTIHSMYLKAHKTTHKCLESGKKAGSSNEQMNLVRVKQDDGVKDDQLDTSNCIVVKTEPSTMTSPSVPHLSGNKSSKSTADKPFKCVQCEYKTAKFADLKRHEKIHSADRPWKCDQCNYRSTNSSNLKTHRMVHSGEKPFKCDQCEFKSLRSSDLKRHKMLHSGEKPHHCDTCSYKTAYQTDLKKHKLTHLRPISK